VDKQGFTVEVTPRGKHTFGVTSNDTPTFLAFVLSRLRSTHQLTAREVAERLESSSPNRYARYEQGKAMPKLDTLEELLKAISSDLELVLKIT
jgi:predicted transcriptional regulator